MFHPDDGIAGESVSSFTLQPGRIHYRDEACCGHHMVSTGKGFSRGRHKNRRDKPNGFFVGIGQGGKELFSGRFFRSGQGAKPWIGSLLQMPLHSFSLLAPPSFTFCSISLVGFSYQGLSPPPVPEQILGWGLGPGESSVLALAYANRGMEAIIDDLAGRRCASLLGIPVRGTLGIVLAAKKRGFIPQAPTRLTIRAQSLDCLSEQIRVRPRSDEAKFTALDAVNQ
jgi:hypothetical protein